jgi:hypothetical protein
MPRYRMTLRIRQPGRQYDVRDVDAVTMRAALAQLVDDFPADGEQSDLLEVRLHLEPEERAYSAG